MGVIVTCRNVTKFVKKSYTLYTAKLKCSNFVVFHFRAWHWHGVRSWVRSGCDEQTVLISLIVVELKSLTGTWQGAVLVDQHRLHVTYLRLPRVTEHVRQWEALWNESYMYLMTDEWSLTVQIWTWVIDCGRRGDLQQWVYKTKEIKRTIPKQRLIGVSDELG